MRLSVKGKAFFSIALLPSILTLFPFTPTFSLVKN